MSDSLRDQLLKAGFSESRQSDKQRKRKSRRSAAQRKGQQDGGSGNAGSQQAADAARAAEQEQRKAAKRRIQALIEEQAIKDFSGEHAWHYQVESRIRQVFVTETIRQRLVDGQLVLTRLNGSSYVVPVETGDAILAINPDWVVFRQQHTANDADGDYADFPVPDDLQW